MRSAVGAAVTASRAAGADLLEEVDVAGLVAQRGVLEREFLGVKQALPAPAKRYIDIQRIEIIHAISGSSVMEIHRLVKVDFTANSVFMVAVLILAAKKLNVPRAWLSILPPQEGVAASIRLPILMQVPSEETMEWLARDNYTCAVCGDPRDPRLDDNGCIECSPCWLCRSCHVVVDINEIQVLKYCLACLPSEMVDDLGEPHRTRLEVLRQYWDSDR